MSEVVGAIGRLGLLAVEYATATEERRQQILTETDHLYSNYKHGLASLPGVLAAQDAKADADLKAKFDVPV